MRLSLFTRTGAICFAIILLVSLSTGLISAQSPSATATPNGQPALSSAPAISSFAIDTGTNGPGVVGGGFGNNGGSVFSNNSQINAYLKYCYDASEASPGASVSASPASASPVPTVGVSIPAVPGTCIFSASTSIVFNNVPEGEHTFSVELIKPDGSSFTPRAYMSTRTNVIHVAGGGGGFFGGKTTGNNTDVTLTVNVFNVVLLTPTPPG